MMQLLFSRPGLNMYIHATHPPRSRRRSLRVILYVKSTVTVVWILALRILVRPLPILNVDLFAQINDTFACNPSSCKQN